MSPQLTGSELASIIYHDIFDYPLTKEELKKWKVGKDWGFKNLSLKIEKQSKFFFLKGRKIIVKKRLEKERIFEKKFEIAERASKIFSLIPTIKMVAVTGSLAMKNAKRNSDVDLMLVTKKGSLWTTRAACLFLTLFGLPVRIGKENPKDKLCLNIWLDETDLAWPKNDRNIYSAHEIGQIIPLVNKDETYERFIYKNKWILGFWPNVVEIKKTKFTKQNPSILSVFERVARVVQYLYMRSKISREVVTPTRALFHPNDCGKMVLDKMESYLLK